MMDYQVLFNISIMVAGFFGGWVLRSIYRLAERLDVDVRAMPMNYVSKDDYHRDIAELKDICSKIFDKLDHKADK